MSTSSNPIKSSGVCGAPCRPTRVFEGHTNWVNSVVYFPDGRQIASASNDKTVIIWDAKSGRQNGQPLLHDFSVGWIAISPDGRRVASGTEKGGVVVWDALTQEVVHEIKGGIRTLAYSPNGCWIAAMPIDDERAVHLWDADTGRPGREPLKCDGNVMCVAFSPDGSRIAAGLENGSFQVIDILAGDSVLGPIKGHEDFVKSIVYLPDGRLVTASADQSIRVWDSNTGVEVGKPILYEEFVNCISITADGRRIASAGSDGTARVWDLETRLQVGDSLDAGDAVFPVAFSPDGRYLISADYDVVCLWDTESFTNQGSSSPPTASTRIPPTPITQPISSQARAKSRTDVTSSITSSLLDLPAVVQQQPVTQRPQERKPSVDDDWDTESIRPRPRPTEPQQGPPLEQETSPVQPDVSGHKWSRDLRERWRRIRPRKSPAPADIPSRSSPPPDKQPIVPVSPELPTDPQTRVTSVAQPSVPGRPWSRNIRELWERIRLRKFRASADLPDSFAPIPLHERPNVPASPGLPTNPPGNAQAPSRTQPPRNQNDVSPPIAANVASGKAYDRMAAAPPRDRNERRRWRARQRRRAARNDDDDDDSDSEPEENDAESYYEDLGCLDAFCFLECVRWWRHRHPQ